jgi:hypothetical protein
LKAVTAEFKLRMEAGKTKSEMVKCVTGRTFRLLAGEEDFPPVRDAEPELVDEYLQGSFLGTCPEFAACFHFKQCLRVLGREGEFDASCREALVRAAACHNTVDSWDTIRIQVLRDMLVEGAEVPTSPFLASDDKKQKSKAGRG